MKGKTSDDHTTDADGNCREVRDSYRQTGGYFCDTFHPQIVINALIYLLRIKDVAEHRTIISAGKVVLQQVIL